VKIVCASSVLFGREAFQSLGDVVIVPDYELSNDILNDADALIVRSKTKITAKLLEGTRVGFVGTATAGYDHMDTDFLHYADIAWCAAPGCNANSVSEYIAAALLCLGQRHHFDLAGKVIGVIGVGQVGGRVAKKAEALGMKVLRNDPPLALSSDELGFVSLEDVLHEADIITLHVPLTRTGKFPTFHMADCHFFEHMKPGCLFVNAARGEAVESDGLLFALEKGFVGHAVLDVWEGEPLIPRKLLEKIDIGTSHIAGWSFEGRLNGTLQVYREACHFFEAEPKWAPEEKNLPPPRVPEISVDANGKSDESVLWEIVRAAYDIEADDRALRASLIRDEPARATHFDTLRRMYPNRREFAAINVRLAHASPELKQTVFGLGFRVVSAA
jgi:erythronate-4-phosphate dehydrogenase